MSSEKLLLKPIWNYTNICDYLGCKKTKAYELMKIARTKYGGSVRGNSSFITRDSLLLTIGTSVEREIYILREIKRKEEKLNANNIKGRNDYKV